MAPPNGVRLSCAAVVCSSQMQFYYDGRRQLQPLVRLRTDNRRSDPSWDRRVGALTEPVPCTAAVMPAGMTLGSLEKPRPRRPTRPSLERNFQGLERT